MANEMAETIFYGGDIITMDEEHPQSGEVEAIAVRGDVIIEVGTRKQVFLLKGPETKMIDLQNQTLMPGFIEPHQHALLCSLVRSSFTNISGLNYRKFDEVREVMIEAVQKANDNHKWGLFFGWDPELIRDLPILTMTYLDEHIASDVPVVVVGQSGHIAWANSLTFEKAKITDDVVDPPGGTFVKDSDGKLTGAMYNGPAIEQVLRPALVSINPLEVVKGISDQLKHYASVGITTVTEMASPLPTSPLVKWFMNVVARLVNFPVRIGVYHSDHPQRDVPTTTSGSESSSESVKHKILKAQSCCAGLSSVFSKLSIDIEAVQHPLLRPASPEDVESTGIGSNPPRIWDAGVKFFADGSPHSGTAAVSEPYLITKLTEVLGFPGSSLDPPEETCGMLDFQKEEFVDSVRRLTREGKQVAVHCHGECACEMVLNGYEQVFAEAKDQTNPCRHRIEHAGLMTPDQIARAGKINVAVSFFVDHLRFYAPDYVTDILGEDRVNRWTPLSEATKSGITWTIHQDHPTFPGDAAPFANMKTAVTRTSRDDPTICYGPEYCVTIHEALKAYTINAAWQLHLDTQVGTITVGKQADLVILSDNPYNTDPFKLEDIKVMETFLSGRRVYIGDQK